MKRLEEKHEALIKEKEVSLLNESLFEHLINLSQMLCLRENLPRSSATIKMKFSALCVCVYMHIKHKIRLKNVCVSVLLLINVIWS